MAKHPSDADLERYCLGMIQEGPELDALPTYRSGPGQTSRRSQAREAAPYRQGQRRCLQYLGLCTGRVRSGSPSYRGRIGWVAIPGARTCRAEGPPSGGWPQVRRWACFDGENHGSFDGWELVHFQCRDAATIGHTQRSAPEDLDSVAGEGGAYAPDSEWALNAYT
jgi:hypothetical protein